MSKQVVIVDKPIGKTPLDMVRLFKEKYPAYKDTTVSYAGRLDPMARGILLLLIGEENKNRQMYLHLNKRYEVEILFGFSTDTYDVLGKIKKQTNKIIEQKELTDVLKTFIGKQKQKYPPYSSKSVQAKPLFWWARNNKLNEIEIPSKEIEIFRIDLLSTKRISGKALFSEIKKRIQTVEGNFRQEEILALWENGIDPVQMYTLQKIVIESSSGVYMRSIVHQVGELLQTPAVAFDIHRIQVGEYSRKDCIDI